MHVHKYIPHKMYGFAIDSSGEQTFFHLGSFHPGQFDLDPPPPPILGEPVEVELDREKADNKARRASRVQRVQQPTALAGRVESFDTERGYGFIEGHDSVSYHLHRSEILNNRVPLPGNKVRFFAGIRQGRPRACHVLILREGDK